LALLTSIVQSRDREHPVSLPCQPILESGPDPRTRGSKPHYPGLHESRKEASLAYLLLNGYSTGVSHLEAMNRRS